tara:strand:- start:681 stop:824 length:144 start_codon:yes stop_codon:yes gene_type:complete
VTRWEPIKLTSKTLPYSRAYGHLAESKAPFINALGKRSAPISQTMKG